MGDGEVGTGFPQAMARVERLCSDYHLLLKGGCGSQRMELERTVKAEKINNSSTPGEAALGLATHRR